MNKRVKILKEQIFEDFYKKKDWWGDNLTILDQVEIAKKPIAVRKAIAFEKVMREMPIEIRDHELLVCIPTMSSVGFGYEFPRYETDEEAEKFAKINLNRYSVWGHHMPHYATLLEKGYEGLIADIDEKLDNTEDLDEESINFYKSARYTLEAASILPERYVDALSKKIREETNLERKKELKEIQEICRKVPMKPAENFHEALQSVLFAHLTLHSTMSFTPLGRIDQYLWPYYKKDIEAGNITKEYARELIASFWVKVNTRVQFVHEHMEDHSSFGDWSAGGDPGEPTSKTEMQNQESYTFGQSFNHWLQSATVGGLGPDGKDATNDLSYLLIETINELELISPTMTARLHKDSPEEYLKFLGAELSEGGAQPQIFNDDPICKGYMERLDIPKEDAYDYASDGCWETLIYGKTEYLYGHIEVVPSLEAIYNNGKSLVDDTKVGIDMGDVSKKLKTFEDFYQAYIKQVRYRIDQVIKNKRNYYDRIHEIAPDPFLSTMVHDCIEKGKDISHKGARYTIFTMLATGLAHAVDSLLAIKYMVYDKEIVTLVEAIDAVKKNWEGYEGLKARCLNEPPKYGNDNTEADKIMVRFLTDFCDHAEEWNNKIDWLHINSGVATFENYPKFGNKCWASFDGRKAHEALASNFSPAVGRDENGPTAVVHSATKFDTSRLNCGAPLDMRFSFNKETKEEENKIMADFIKSFIDMGGNMLTVTKADIDTLKKAQKDPQNYKSLRVRLGGINAYFVALAEQQQNEYMRRTGQEI